MIFFICGECGRGYRDLAAMLVCRESHLGRSPEMGDAASEEWEPVEPTKEMIREALKEYWRELAEDAARELNTEKGAAK